ncbi:MAG: TetR/AcrR family transcriptional regulator [Rubrobacter sp.]|nr:TetR/AcrR family transcriptional regulator [Rubrobacter sp.]
MLAKMTREAKYKRRNGTISRLEAEKRRGQILDVALELFLRQGYDGTPAREIAEAAGTGKANLYHHFPSKDELLYALLAPLLDELESVLDNDSFSYGGVPERAELLGHYLDACLRHRGVAVFVSNNLILRANPRVGPRISEIHARLLDRLCGKAAEINERVRAAGAVAVLHSAMLDFEERNTEKRDTDELREAVLEAARILLPCTESAS